MTRNTFSKFFAISVSNLRKFLLINGILFIPAALVLFSLFQLIPALIHYVDSLNVSVTDVAPRYQKLAVVILWGREDRVYVFEKRVLGGVRRHVFLSGAREESARLLERAAIATGSVESYRAPFPLYGKSGEYVLTLQIRSVREGSIEFLFYDGWKPIPTSKVLLYSVILAVSFLFLSGTLGGITDYTQRVVFHEMKGLAFLFVSIRRNFFRSILVAVALTVVLGAVAANIYFYIFMLSTDVSVFIAAVNFWMLVFFFIALLWTYPLMILNREESLWSVVKKSLYISFDNLEYSLITLLYAFAMAVISLCTLTLFPGFAGGFSFLNNALKDLSARYNRSDTA
jgi:uncharacterized membrane protein YesL